MDALRRTDVRYDRVDILLQHVLLFRAQQGDCKKEAGAPAGPPNQGLSLQKNLIVVIEEPENPRNIGTTIRNVNALGAEKVYVVDPRHVLSGDWQDLRSEPKVLS